MVSGEGPLMVRLSVCVALCVGIAESCTSTVKVEVPCDKGVPEICPSVITVGGVPEVVVIVCSVNPGGNVPLNKLHVSGGIPPFELIDALYATPTNPCGSDVVTMEMGCAGVIVILNNSLSVAGGIALSATCTVNDDVPELLGVPAITPFVPRLNPAGRLPEATVKTSGVTPPVTASFSL